MNENDKYIQEVATEAAITADKIRQALTDTGTNATGKTMRSIRVEPDKHSVKIVGLKGFSRVEFGSKEGERPLGFVEIIKAWIEAKGIQTTPIPYVRQESNGWKPKYTEKERGLNAAAGAIAASIEKSGTKLYKEGGRSNIYTENVKELITNVNKKLSGVTKALILEGIRQHK